LISIQFLAIPCNNKTNLLSFIFFNSVYIRELKILSVYYNKKL
jgi:hypothetical protein